MSFVQHISNDAAQQSATGLNLLACVFCGLFVCLLACLLACLFVWLFVCSFVHIHMHICTATATSSIPSNRHSLFIGCGGAWPTLFALLCLLGCVSACAVLPFLRVVTMLVGLGTSSGRYRGKQKHAPNERHCALHVQLRRTHVLTSCFVCSCVTSVPF